MKKVKLSLIFIGIIIIIAGLNADFSPVVDSSQRFARASADALFGRDYLGRNLLSMISAGLLVSISISAVVTVISLLLGVLLATLLSGRRGSSIFFAFLDSMKALPPIVLALFLASLGGPGTIKLVAAMVVANVSNVARTCYARIAVLKKEPFVLASMGLGISRWKVFWSHILPHLSGYLREQGLSLMIASIITEVSLSYLGCGVKAGTPSLGGIIADARAYVLSYPEQIIIPAIVLMVYSFFFVLLAKGLSELDSASERSC